MNKIKFELEIPVHASPNMLYQYISSPSNLQEWFADKVNSRGKMFTFTWEGVEEKAELITKKSDDRIRFKWIESEDDESYFEIKIQVDALTKDVSLIVTDFADDEDEVEESKQLWENQIDELKHTIGA
ncbi:Activator of Hsp90 ATPase homolog 1-like protein [Polaribacter sp. KT25b]|uniref:START-like domain-containing protein n=1 Tax=Polaribacter sp. KT25b TaxID=1855336 RepID=UPI000879694E|nr:START-like domain-containing protein [Polaribacter sp. KT25b]SDS09290.1 Activator of Hsp90 ATPase homolog 1-like protein [Polaribacter sp. KT25b]